MPSNIWIKQGGAWEIDNTVNFWHAADIGRDWRQETGHKIWVKVVADWVHVWTEPGPPTVPDFNEQVYTKTEYQAPGTSGDHIFRVQAQAAGGVAGVNSYQFGTLTSGIFQGGTYSTEILKADTTTGEFDIKITINEPGYFVQARMPYTASNDKGQSQVSDLNFFYSLQVL